MKTDIGTCSINRTLPSGAPPTSISSSLALSHWLTDMLLLGLLLVTGRAWAIDSTSPKAQTAPFPARAEPGRMQRLDGPNQVPEGLSASDWASIRAAYEAARHQAVAVAGGYQARNPGQQWRTRFDGRGFLVEPEHNQWQWGLELRGYGFAGQERGVATPSHVNAQGQRVVYDWDDAVQEWFLNDRRGLEHGFTVWRRPPVQEPGNPGQDCLLSFRLGVRGGLRPEVQADGLGVRFVDAQGGAALTYNGLAVHDASGRTLPARFEPWPGGREGGESLRLIIEQRDARYPIRIDPIAQQAYLKASNTGAIDFFGYSVAISGGTVVVGAYLEDSNATGVNGNQSDNSASAAGAAYVFVRSGTTWSQQAYLKASNTGATDGFGYSVAISGDTVVIGAIGEDSNATGVNGNQSDNSAVDSGAAYVFVRSSTTWSQQADLKASNTGASDYFGYSVAISGDTVVVGAYGEASNATGVNGNQSDNSAGNAGAAYVFVRSGTSWSQQAYLKASNTGAGDRFGYSVAISGDTVVAGATYEASNATGVNGNQSDNSAGNAGAAYVFVRSGTSWSQQAYLKASNTGAGDRFGYSVAISGDTVVAGAIYEASNATGVNGNQSDNSAGNAGAAYVFVRSGTSWSQQAYLKASNTGVGDVFGFSVAISGDTVVVGAPFEDSNATGVNAPVSGGSGTQSDYHAPGAGAAYVFVRSGTSWSQQAYLKASNTEELDDFGRSVAISGDTVVVGADMESSNATGVNGNQSDNNASDSGAAYVFNIPTPPLVFTGCPANITVRSSDGNPNQCSQVAWWTPPTASDSCGSGITLTSNHSPGETFPLGATTVIYTALDGCGNSQTCSFTVTVQDNSPPVIGAITATQGQPGGAMDVKDCAQSALQGVILFSVAASDNCSMGDRTINLMRGDYFETATFVNQSPAGTFNFVWIVTPTTPNGSWTAMVMADDGLNQSMAYLNLCVDRPITGQVELEGFKGTAVGHTRTVTFVATQGATVLKTWSLPLVNASDAVFNYTLTGAPAAMDGLSAKTNWNLRRKLPVALDANGQAVANFTGGTMLKGGDINGSNDITLPDYSAVVTYWHTLVSSVPGAAVADIDGDGQISLGDYQPLVQNWHTAGDPQ